MRIRTGTFLRASVLLGCISFVAGCSGTATAPPAAEGSVSASAQAAATDPSTQTAQASSIAADPTPVQSSEPAAASRASSEQPTIRYFKPGEIAIPAGLSDEELVNAFIERSTAWIMAGTSPEIYDRYIRKAAGADLLYESGLAHGMYVAELFPEERNPLIDDFLSSRVERVQKVAQLYAESAPHAQAQPDLYEPYRQWFELLKVNSTSGTKGGSRTIEIEYAMRSNDEKTQPSFGKPLEHPPYPIRAGIAFDESSGHALIKSIGIMHLR